jgi:hypothetical protein
MLPGWSDRLWSGDARFAGKSLWSGEQRDDDDESEKTILGLPAAKWQNSRKPREVGGHFVPLKNLMGS